MPTSPWTDVLAAVPALNDDQAPFSYAVNGETIVGQWDVAKIEMLGLAGASSFSKDYRIEVRADGEGTVVSVEQHDESSTSGGVGGLSGSWSSFRGTTTSKSFGITLGAGGTSHGEPTTAATWSFDTEEIKRPLFALLGQHGWRRKGFFARLFG